MKSSVLSLLLLETYAGCGQFPKSIADVDKNSNKPNIIFLLTDDLRWDALGFMGNKDVITPHIDNLANQSVSFYNVYHVAPVCMPSRSSIMTGQYLGTHGSGFDRPTNYVITEDRFAASYPVLLKKAGYYNGFIGKFGFAVSKKLELNEGRWQIDEYMPKNHFDVWNGFPEQGNYRIRKDGTFNGYENKWGATHLNEFMGHQVEEFIQKAKLENQPFCLSVSFKAPHDPFDPEEDVRKLYDNKIIPRTVNDNPEYFRKLPKVVQEKSRNARWYFGDNRPVWHIEKDSTYQEFIKNYYALITGVDNVVGQIRNLLSGLGIADNTVIIFTSDNGFFCGSRQLMGKELLYDESSKAPLIVFDPRYMKGKNARMENGLVSIIDFAPTILDLAGVEKPESMPGQSIMPLVYDKTEKIHDAVFGENNFDSKEPVISEVEDPENYQSIRSKFVRTKDFKFIRYHECHPVVEELFKMSEDTLEFDNLINNPEFKNVALEMRSLLDDFERKYVKYRNPVSGK